MARRSTPCRSTRTASLSCAGCDGPPLVIDHRAPRVYRGGTTYGRGHQSTASSPTRSSPRFMTVTSTATTTPGDRRTDGLRQRGRSRSLLGCARFGSPGISGYSGGVVGAGGPLDDETATARAVDLCRAAEAARGELLGGAPAPVYVIGTEVPAPHRGA